MSVLFVVFVVLIVDAGSRRHKSMLHLKRHLLECQVCMLFTDLLYCMMSRFPRILLQLVMQFKHFD